MPQSAGAISYDKPPAAVLYPPLALRVIRAIRGLHLAVPVLGLGGRRPEHFKMPLAPAPRLDDLGRDDVDQQLGERAALGITLETIGGLVPCEVRVDRHGQEQIVAVVDDDDLTDGALLRGVVDEILLGAMRADVPFQREITRDDLFDGNFLVPALTAIAFLTAGFRHFLGATQ